MKTKFLFILSGLLISVFTLSSFKKIAVLNTTECNIQETKVVNAVFDGHEDYGYNFIAKDEDGDEYTVTFQEVEDSVLKAFNLNSEALIGTKFKVTYTSDVEVTVDEDGYEYEEEVNTITKLEKL